MKHLLAASLVLLAAGLVCTGLASSQDTARQTVYVLPVKGPIDKSMLFVFRRAFREAKRSKPAAVILELDTPGGALRETEEIVAWLRSLEIPKYAFVNTHAQSAGAIISLGTGKIFMAPGSRIGSAMPIVISPIGGGVQQLPADIKEKMLSDVRSMVRGLAQENGHSEEVAEAMVDAAKEVKIGERVICPAGQLLNLTAKEAVEIVPPSAKPVLATAIVDDIQAILKHEGLEGAELVQFQEESAERLARYITLIGPLLLALGVLGVYIEIKTPGFGIPGIAGICLLSLYFFGHYVAGLAGLEEIALVFVGFVLLAVEIFVLPGFGIAGLAGIACIIAGIILGLLPHLPSGPLPLPDVAPTAMADYLREALFKFVMTLVLGGLGGWALAKILPKTPLYRGIVLDKSLAQGAGQPADQQESRASLLGCEGTCATALHPSGIAVVDGNRLDVVSSGDLIPKGSPIRVVQIEGSRIVVEPLSGRRGTGQPA